MKDGDGNRDGPKLLKEMQENLGMVEFRCEGIHLATVENNEAASRCEKRYKERGAASRELPR